MTIHLKRVRPLSGYSTLDVTETTDEAVDLRRRIEDLQALTERLQARLATTAEEAGRSAERARLHAADAAAQRELLARSEAVVRALMASTSWRLTFPLRATAKLLRRLSLLRTRPSPSAAPPPRARAVRQPGPPSGFPLPGDVAAHPALLAARGRPLDTTVSVVIPTWNAGAELHWLIRKLRAQRGLRGIEIIIVDSESGDGTPELAESLGCRVVPIEQAAFSHSAARNLGASVATGDLLLFMVQDAYPVGEDWLAGMARALLHPRREEDRLAALSCAEFSRTDSELIYDVMARTHYEFLGCADGDRVGRLTTPDQVGLRQQGQLSDVACLIPRALFENFLFRGRYAEDLTLGIRLIEAGHQLGMLSSIRVIHSHCRPAGYYVRRVFVDVIFLAGAFVDFDFPAGHDPVGAAIGCFTLALTAASLPDASKSQPAALLEALLDRLRDAAMPEMGMVVPRDGDFGFAPLGDWLARLFQSRSVVGRALSAAELRGAREMRETAVARLTALHPFVARAWPVADAAAMRELADAVMKTLAMSLGAQLAYCHLAASRSGADDPLMEELRPLLLTGI